MPFLELWAGFANCVHRDETTNYSSTEVIRSMTVQFVFSFVFVSCFLALMLAIWSPFFNGNPISLNFYLFVFYSCVTTEGMVQFHIRKTVLTLILLNPEMLFFASSVDQDQLASSEAN